MPALRTSEPSPKVMIVSGSAMRMTIGHRTALISAIVGGDEHRGVEGERFDTGQDRGQREEHQALRSPAGQRPGRPTRATAAHFSRAARAALIDRWRHLVATFSPMADGAILARRAGTSADRIVFLGHATVLIELDGVRLLTDPLLRGRVAHLRRQVSPVEDSVFAEPRCGADLTPASRSPRPGLAAAAGSRHAPARAGRRRGVAAEPGVYEGDRAERGRDGERRCAHRDSGRGSPRSLAAGRGRVACAPRRSGYVVRGRRTIYFAGDTELFAGMSDLAIVARRRAAAGRRLGADAWTGSHGPTRRRASGRLDATAPGDPDALGNAAADRDRRAPPGRGSVTRLAQFAEHVASLAPGVEVRILQPGQGTML